MDPNAPSDGEQADAVPIEENGEIQTETDESVEELEGAEGDAQVIVQNGEENGNPSASSSSSEIDDVPPVFSTSSIVLNDQRERKSQTSIDFPYRSLLKEDWKFSSRVSTPDSKASTPESKRSVTGQLVSDTPCKELVSAFENLRILSTPSETFSFHEEPSEQSLLQVTESPKASDEVTLTYEFVRNIISETVSALNLSSDQPEVQLGELQKIGDLVDPLNEPEKKIEDADQKCLDSDLRQTVSDSVDEISSEMFEGLAKDQPEVQKLTKEPEQDTQSAGDQSEVILEDEQKIGDLDPLYETDKKTEDEGLKRLDSGLTRQTVDDILGESPSQMLEGLFGVQIGDQQGQETENDTLKGLLQEDQPEVQVGDLVTDSDKETEDEGQKCLDSGLARQTVVNILGESPSQMLEGLSEVQVGDQQGQETENGTLKGLPQEDQPEVQVGDLVTDSAKEEETENKDQKDKSFDSPHLQWSPQSKMDYNVFIKMLTASPASVSNKEWPYREEYFDAKLEANNLQQMIAKMKVSEMLEVRSGSAELVEVKTGSLEVYNKITSLTLENAEYKNSIDKITEEVTLQLKEECLQLKEENLKYKNRLNGISKERDGFWWKVLKDYDATLRESVNDHLSTKIKYEEQLKKNMELNLLVKDLSERYDKCKTAIKGLTENEDIYKRVIDGLQKVIPLKDFGYDLKENVDSNIQANSGVRPPLAQKSKI